MTILNKKGHLYANYIMKNSYSLCVAPSQQVTKPGLLHLFWESRGSPNINLHELPLLLGAEISGGGHRSLQATSTWSRFGLYHNKQSSLIG